jgi:hypothetical protein
MKKYFVLIIPAILALGSCMWGVPHNQKAAVTKDTLAYTYKLLKQRASDCGTKPDSGCTVPQIKYPVFTSDKQLNDTIIVRLIHLLMLSDPAKKADTSLEQLTQNFFKTYYADNYVRERNIFYSLNMKAIVVRQDSSVLTLQLDGYTYQGGAHGSAITSFINWNTKTKKNITLGDIMINGYPDKLTKIADTIFRKQEKLSSTASLSKDYFFKNGQFALNDNYSITPLGIRFLYNEYEIKPYAAGQTDLFIPYVKIKSLLRPNTVITQYIK